MRHVVYTHIHCAIPCMQTRAVCVGVVATHYGCYVRSLLLVLLLFAGCHRATSVNMTLLRLQNSEEQITMSCDIEPVRRSFCRHGSCTFTEVTRLVPSGKRQARKQLLVPGILEYTIVSGCGT